GQGHDPDDHARLPAPAVAVLPVAQRRVGPVAALRFLLRLLDPRRRVPRLAGQPRGGRDPRLPPPPPPPPPLPPAPHRCPPPPRQPQFAPARLNLADLEPPALSLRPDAETVKDKPLRLDLAAVPRGGKDVHRPERVILWVGDHRYRTWSDRDIPADGHFRAQ